MTSREQKAEYNTQAADNYIRNAQEWVAAAHNGGSRDDNGLGAGVFLHRKSCEDHRYQYNCENPHCCHVYHVEKQVDRNQYLR